MFLLFLKINFDIGFKINFWKLLFNPEARPPHHLLTRLIHETGPSSFCVDGACDFSQVPRPALVASQAKAGG